MRELKQTIRFCTSSDGTRIAYATMGSGPPLVRTAHFLTNITRIFDKLRVPTCAQAIVRAREAGFAAAPLGSG